MEDLALDFAGDRTAFVEKTASVISRHSLKSGKALTNQIAAGGTRMASAFDRTTFKSVLSSCNVFRPPACQNDIFVSIPMVYNCKRKFLPGLTPLKK